MEPANRMAGIIGRRRGGRYGKSPEELDVLREQIASRERIAKGGQEQTKLNREARPTEIAQRIEGKIRIGGVDATRKEHLATIKAELAMKEKEFIEAQINGRADEKLKQDYKIHLQAQKTRLAALRTTKPAQPEGGVAGFGQHDSEELTRIKQLEANADKDLEELKGTP
jgi:hypothetical protein